MEISSGAGFLPSVINLYIRRRECYNESSAPQDFLMAMGLLQAMEALVEACSRHVKRLRSHRKLLKLSHGAGKPALGRRASYMPFLSSKKRTSSGRKEEEEEVEGVWRKEILMGEKCQPLDFSGVIYYDTDGKRLSEIPVPRSPLRNVGGKSPLPSFSFHPVIIASEDKA